MVNVFLSRVAQAYYPEFEPADMVVEPPIWVLAFIATIVWIVNRFERKTLFPPRRTIANRDLFDDLEFRLYLERFCSWQCDALNSLERGEYRVAYAQSTEIEVEVSGPLQRRRKLKTIRRAIYEHPAHPIFLLLGEPGSGKSFSLRSLCHGLCRSPERLRREVPIYVDLSRWQLSPKPDPGDPLTVDSFKSFVRTNIESEPYIHEFVDRYFDTLFAGGHLLFLLDSFDEIPLLLNEHERSWLHGNYSDLLYDVLAHSERGIVASRPFRRPTWGSRTGREVDETFRGRFTQLTVRPLDEDRILKTFAWNPFFTSSFLDEIFRQKPHLAPLVRNPLTANLLAEYAESHGGATPSNQAELYGDFIDVRLQAVDADIRAEGLSQPEVKATAIEISLEMLSRESSFEVTVSELAANLENRPVRKVVELLTRARLGRLGWGTGRRFSFRHRRFAEYFAALGLAEPDTYRRLIGEPQGEEWVGHEVFADVVVWREPLVLLCELDPPVDSGVKSVESTSSDSGRASLLAESCWRFIQQHTSTSPDIWNLQFKRTLLSLRFLSEAFRSKPDAVTGFRPQLEGLVERALKAESNQVVANFAVETVGLMSEKGILRTVVRTLELGNEWIIRTALRACRHLPRISEELEGKLLDYIWRIPQMEILLDSHSLSFSLSLSDGFRSVRWMHRFRQIDAVLLLASLVLLSIHREWFIWVPLFALVVAAGMPFGRKSQIALTKSTFFLRMFLALFLLLALFQVATVFWILGRLLPWTAIAWAVEKKTPLFVIGAILFQPYTDLLYLSKRGFDRGLELFIEDRSLFISLAVGLLVALTATAALLPIYTVSMKQADRAFERGTGFDPGSLLWAAMAICLVGGLVVYLLRFLRDFRRYRRVGVTPSMTRQRIATALDGLSTDFFRLRFVRRLRGEAVKAIDEWPDRAYLSLSEDGTKDSALEELAQLEVNWLELDRLSMPVRSATASPSSPSANLETGSSELRNS